MTPNQLHELITHFREATSVNLHHLKGFKIGETHEVDGVAGFDFVVDDPKTLAQQMRDSSDMAEDPAHKDHYSPWTRTASFGFTEITQPSHKTGKWPKALHVDFSLNSSKCCGMHLDDDHRVVGRDRNGHAVCNYLNHAIVRQVIHEVSLRGIPLQAFTLRPIRVYDEPEPLGFDFESPDIAAIESIVRGLSTHNEPTTKYPKFAPGKLNPPMDLNKVNITPDPPYRHDNSRDPVGWVGNRVTLGQGYREKGPGLRVHIELAQDFNLGNVHLDTHAYLRADGSMDIGAAAKHGVYDLFTGFGMGGRTQRYTWQLLPGLSWTPGGSRQSGELGVPLQPLEGGTFGGWTIGLSLLIRGRTSRHSRR